MPSSYQDLADAAFNAASRLIEAKIEIYFTSEPLVVTRDNYLLSFELLEELGADSTSNPIGTTSANEFNLKLLNTGGIFSPSNTNSPYYSLMKAGVMVKVYLKESTLSAWEPMGTFFVDDWYAEVTSLQASVSCFDAIYSIINSSVVTPRSLKDATYKQAFSNFLDNFLFNHEIDSSITGDMSWWYAKDTNAATLQNLSEASLAATYCDRYGTIVVESETSTKELRAIISDSDQIITATVPQSINKSFNGVAIMLNAHQLAEVRSLIDISEYTAPVGLNQSAEVAFTNTPAVRIESIKVISASPLVKYIKHFANTNFISFLVSNDGLEPFKVSISVLGRLAEIVKTVYNKYGSSPLLLDNVYVQNESQAALQTSVLDRFVRSNLPVLRLETRGNPAIHLGSKVRVVSSNYSLDFTGVVQRASYVYTGSLKCNLTVVASNVLEVT